MILLDGFLQRQLLEALCDQVVGAPVTAAAEEASGVLLAYAVVSFWVALALTRKRFGQ